MLGSKVKWMIGISVPVPSVDDGAIVAALHIVWALRGRAATRVSAVCSNAGLSAALLMSFWRGVGNAASRCPLSVDSPPPSAFAFSLEFLTFNLCEALD